MKPLRYKEIVIRICPANEICCTTKPTCDSVSACTPSTDCKDNSPLSRDFAYSSHVAHLEERLGELETIFQTTKLGQQIFLECEEQQLEQAIEGLVDRKQTVAVQLAKLRGEK